MACKLFFVIRAVSGIFSRSSLFSKSASVFFHLLTTYLFIASSAATIQTAAYGARTRPTTRASYHAVFALVRIGAADNHDAGRTAIARRDRRQTGDGTVAVPERKERLDNAGLGCDLCAISIDDRSGNVFHGVLCTTRVTRAQRRSVARRKRGRAQARHLNEHAL